MNVGTLVSLVFIDANNLFPAGPKYLTTTAVAISEVSKMVLCSLILLVEHIRNGESILYYFKYMYRQLIVNWKDTLKLSIPAVVYALQNNLQYVAVSNLNAAVFQVCGREEGVYLCEMCVAVWMGGMCTCMSDGGVGSEDVCCCVRCEGLMSVLLCKM